MKAMKTLAWSVLAGALLWAPLARGELPPACEELGQALTEHTCFHATNGPFLPVEGVAVGAGGVPPSVDAPHTLYEVTLPSGASAARVSYAPATAARAGTWAIFHPKEVSVTVRSSGGASLEPLLRSDAVPCLGLPSATVFDLPVERVELTLDGGGHHRVLLAFEALDDFMTFQGIDADGDGHGGPEKVRVTPCAPAPGYGVDDADCNDADPTVYPGAPETCDGEDKNCNGIPGDVGLPCSAGVGACRSDGVVVCEKGALMPSCAGTPLSPQPELCDGIDSNCDGVEDGEDPSVCLDVAAPRCVATGSGRMCGCQDDADCAGELVCDDGERRCKKPLPNNGGSGSSGGAQQSSPEPDLGGSEASPPEDGGCACSTRGRVSALGAPSLLVAALALIERRRRRRVSLAATVMLGLSACGGAVVSEEEERLETPPPLECGQAASADVRIHACQHGRLGPYDDGAAPRDLSATHRTYRFPAGEAPSLGIYRATRPGVHVVFSRGVHDLTLVGESAALIPSIRNHEQIDCAAFSDAVIVELEAGASYEVRASSTDSGAQVFFEHAASFAAGGITTVCVEKTDL